jgi:glycine hydroxymethyltransferase
MFAGPLAFADAQVAGMIQSQRAQNETTINLVASESYCPRATLEAEASALVNKNASGYPPRRSFGGSDLLDRIENLAVERARRLFGAEHANVQALSSTIANIAVLRALVPRGGRILSLDPAAGGHGSHGSSRHLSGQDYEVRHFGVVEETGDIDYAAAAETARGFRPAMIVAGSSAHPRIVDFARLHEIAREADALLFADIAHVSGLIVAGLHPDPVPFCDVVTTSTHKTLCGPRTGGLVLCKAHHGKAIDAALMPGLQAAAGGHIIAARAVLFELVRRPEFRDLMRAVAANARVLADELARLGLRLFGGGTETHMVVVDLRGGAIDAAKVNRRLFRHRLVANTVRLPLRGSALGLRLGSTAMTIRGAGAAEFTQIARSLAAVLAQAPEAGEDPAVVERMQQLAARFPIPFQ